MLRERTDDVDVGLVAGAEEDALDGAVCRWNEQDAAVLGLEIMGGRHSAQRL